MATSAAKPKKSIPRKLAQHPAPMPPGYDMSDGSTLASRQPTAIGQSTLTVIPLADLVRHPRNRTIDPTSPDILELSNSIAEHGQLDPLRVRSMGNGKYQIIGGERRYHALTLAGSYGARCEIVHCDESTALAEVAAANSHRKDLDPIERAELMQSLMLPISEGGSGMSLVEAGAVFGLRSESGAKNALRLLKLPAKIRKLLTSGDLPERVVRTLIPYAVAPAVIDQIADELNDKSDWIRSEAIASLLSCDGQPPFISEAITQHARPIDPDVKHPHGYPLGEHPCLFDWKEHETKLQIVDLPTELRDERNKYTIEPRKFALNTKLWDKLQLPLVQKLAEEGKKKSGKKKASATQSEKKLTPAQEAQRKAQEAHERLDRFSIDWLCRLLRCSLAAHSSDDGVVVLTLPWIVAHCDRWELADMHEQAMLLCGISPKKEAKAISASERTLDLLPHVTKAGLDARYDVLCAFWRILLWPVSTLIGEHAKRSKLAPAGTLPDGMPKLGSWPAEELEHVTAICSLYKLTLETAWREGGTDDSDQRRLISVWLCRHTKDQLHALRTELNVTEGSSTMGRDELADCILRMHRPGKPLPLPKRLKALIPTSK